MNQFDAVRFFYKDSGPKILASPKNEWAVPPYSWDIFIQMTPIEQQFWEVLRQENIVMYPQYPVGRFFVDFGNPVAKVAVECDGREYHKDKEKDADRDRELNDMGWTVYRITGSDCYEEDEEYEDDDGYRCIRKSFARRIARSLGTHFGIARGGKSMQQAGDTLIPLLEHLLEVNK